MPIGGSTDYVRSFGKVTERILNGVFYIYG